MFKKNPQGFEKLSNTSEKLVKDFLKTRFNLELTGKFFTYRDEVYYSEKYSDIFWEDFFFYKCGVKIGKIESGEFIPNFFLGTHFGICTKNSLTVSEEDLAKLLRGEELESSLEDGYYQIVSGIYAAGIIKVKNTSQKSLLETRFLRK